MPQASTETLSKFTELLRSELGNHHDILQHAAIYILRDNFKERRGMICLKEKQYYWKMIELERYAIKYLIEEWDFEWVDVEPK